MKYLLTDARGNRLGEPFWDRARMRAAGKAHVLNKGGAVMAWLVDDHGGRTYSSKDTAAITQAVVQARGSVPAATVVKVTP